MIRPAKKRANGIGSPLTLLFTDAEIRNYRDAAAADGDLTAAFHLALLLEGVFCAPRGMMATSLAMTEAEVPEALGAAESVLDRLLGML